MQLEKRLQRKENSSKIYCFDNCVFAKKPINTGISKNEDDTCSIMIIPSDDWLLYYKNKNISELDGEEKIFLCITDGAGIPVAENTLADSFDGNKFVFDNLSIFGIEKLNEENKYFAEFLKALHETKIPTTYEIEFVR